MLHGSSIMDSCRRYDHPLQLTTMGHFVASLAMGSPTAMTAVHSEIYSPSRIGDLCGVSKRH